MKEVAVDSVTTSTVEYTLDLFEFYAAEDKQQEKQETTANLVSNEDNKTKDEIRVRTFAEMNVGQ